MRNWIGLGTIFAATLILLGVIGWCNCRGESAAIKEYGVKLEAAAWDVEHLEIQR